MIKRLSCLIACVSALALNAGAVRALPPVTFGAGWRSADCSHFDIPEALIPTADCGYLTVPAIRSQPGSGTIDIAVARFRSASAERRPDPLFMEQGGPGGSTIEMARLLAALPGYKALLEQRDLVFVEQRGTQYSRPFLGCSEAALAKIKDLETPRDDEDRLEGQALLSCAAAYRGRQVNLAAFNTVENADDMIAVADALGYGQINYYGVSYGTALGQYLMRQHPERLRSVILDGVAPVDMYSSAVFTASRAFSYALRAVAVACQADAACNGAYPELETTFLSLVAQLHTQPLKLSADFGALGGIKQLVVTDDDLLNALFTSMYTVEGVAALPGRIYSGKAGDWDWLAALLAGNAGSDSQATLMQTAVNCSHIGTAGSTALKHILPAPYSPLVALDDNLAEKEKQCARIKAPPLPSRYNQPVKSDIPTLVLSGQFDPVTPAPYAQHVAGNLSRSYTLTAPNQTHGALGEDACVTQITLAFLDHPEARPDSACLAQIKLKFALPPTPLQDLTPAPVDIAPNARTVLPSQWRNFDTRIYADANDPTGAAGILILLAGAFDPQGYLAAQSIDPQSGVAYQGKHVAWLVYQTERAGNTVIHAVAASDAGGALVMIGGPSSRIGDLFDAVGRPALDEFEFLAGRPADK